MAESDGASDFKRAPTARPSAKVAGIRGVAGQLVVRLPDQRRLPAVHLQDQIAHNLIRLRDGHVDLRRSIPDVLASTANLLKVNGWQPGASFELGTRNFEVMREWNRSEVYRRTLHYFAEQLR